MNERTTHADYADRLERVFRWLADHLDDTLDLVRLADVACLSPYHFHRVYRASTREAGVTKTASAPSLNRPRAPEPKATFPIDDHGK